MTERRDWLLGHGRMAPGRARRALHEWAIGNALDEQVVDSLLLVVSEMVTNAVEHSSGPVRLRVSTGRRHVTVAVSDSGSGSPWQGHVTDGSVRGRGLVIVDALCDSWGVERRPGGKTVWARVARTAEAR